MADDEQTPEQEPSAERPQEVTVEELMQAMREIKIGAFLLQTASTLASLAYGKLEAGELDEARTAIDAIGALVPVLETRVEEPLAKDFERALANLRLAYASAASRAEKPVPEHPEQVAEPEPAEPAPAEPEPSAESPRAEPAPAEPEASEHDPTEPEQPS